MQEGSVRLALRRLWWVPLLFAVAATGVTGVIALRSPHYQATASVVAQVPANSTDQALSFTDVATSSTVATRALNDTHTGESLTQLTGDLAVIATRSTLYLVTVSDASPEDAVALADAVASEGAAYYQVLAGGAANSVVTNLEADEQQYRARYLAATQALLTFGALNPQVVKGTGSIALNAEYRGLQLDQQAAQNAYLDLHTAAAQARVNQVSIALTFSATVVDRAVAHSQTLSWLLKAGFAGVVGLILGLALAVAIEYLRGPRSGVDRVPTTGAAPTDANGASGGHQPTLPSSAAAGLGRFGRSE
jgi:hypothetical protein